MCWIYYGNRLISLFNIDRIALLNHTNLSFLLDDEKLVHPTPPPPPPTYLGTFSLTQPSLSTDYIDVQATLRPILEEKYMYGLISSLNIPPSMILFKRGMMS